MQAQHRIDMEEAEEERRAEAAERAAEGGSVISGALQAAIADEDLRRGDTRASGYAQS